jgi:hypothetical protein
MIVLHDSVKSQKRNARTRLAAMASLRVAFLFFCLSSALFEKTSRAQDAQASPAQSTPTPAAEASPETSPSPTPEPQTAPDLLPESKTLPPLPPESELPRDLIPEIPKPGKNVHLPAVGSAEQLEKDRIRFRQIRTIAMRDPFAIYLAKRAVEEKTEEGKREYFRAYYAALAIHMRKLEPKLKPIIDGFEAGYIARYVQTKVRPTIPLRDLGRYEKEQAVAGFHR